MQKSDFERRLWRPDRLQLRAAGETTGAILSGHAAVFDQLSEDLGGFRERIAPGAFAGTLGNADIRALWNHDPAIVLGRAGAGTLRLAEDDTGLAIEIDLPDTSWGRDAGISIGRGDVNQMSFGFRALYDHWDEVNGEIIRTLLAVELIEVSPVTFPAYPQTYVSARCRDVLTATRGALDAAANDAARDCTDLYHRRLRLARAR